MISENWTQKCVSWWLAGISGMSEIKASFFLFWHFPQMGHISPTTLRIEVVEILFFEVTRNLKDQVLKYRKRKYMF